MKTLAGITFLLVLFITTINAQDVQSELGVVAVHEIELLPGVDSKAFEAFVLDNIIPVYNSMEGQNAMLVKGDRGVRSLSYALILTFDSIEDRNRIYPPSGEMVGDFGEEAMWQRLMSMSKGLGETFTDYVNVKN